MAITLRTELAHTIGRVSNSDCTTIAVVAATLTTAAYGLGVPDERGPSRQCALSTEYPRMKGMSPQKGQTLIFTRIGFNFITVAFACLW